MQAAVYTRYGAPEVVHIQTIARPRPADDEIRIRIRAAAVSSGDARLRRADPFAVRFFFGLFNPRKTVLGGVFSGEVEAVGKNVRKFGVGDPVFGCTMMQFGAHAEYVCLPENGALAIKPANLSHEEAAALPFGGTTALHFLRKAGVGPGQNVLIYGASGAIGTAAIQLAKYFGARVTAVCSAANFDLVRSLGADEAVDYASGDLARHGARYDVVYETVNKASVSACLALLVPNGTLILGAALLRQMLRGAWAAATGSKKVIFGVAPETAEAVGFLRTLAEAGRLKAVIDRKYSLDEIAAAHAQVDDGHKKGNIIVLPGGQA